MTYFNAVLDLRIEPGVVTAKVQGSQTKPYTVTVTIGKLPEPVWNALCSEALPQLDSLAVLLGGKFPEALKDSFFAQGTGLFPAPGEIRFDCSCPDWAAMCKHVAAVLYGIGNRLDQHPELLFTLRQVSIAELVAGTVKATADNLVQNGDGDGLGDHEIPQDRAAFHRQQLMRIPYHDDCGPGKVDCAQ